MKLLIVTQAVDTEDPALGFFVRWVEEFSKKVESVEVICLKEGKYDLPKNVRVHSLGKEKAPRFARRLIYALRFKRLIWKLRHNYDAVFVHMNPEYVVLGGLFWRLFGKQSALWYTHKNINLKLRIATFFANDIFTASLEGFRLATPKLHVVGHGIDTAKFYAPIRPLATPIRIVSVGRITPIKNLKTLIEAVSILKEKGVSFMLTLIGVPIHSSDTEYLKSLQKLVAEKGISDQVIFAGNVPHAEMPEQYRRFDVSVNLCPTGGLDKAVLESMAAGLLVFMSNRAFAKLLGPHTEELLFPERDAVACAEKMTTLMHHTEEVKRIRVDLQQRVETMSLQSLIQHILSFYVTSR